MKTCIVLYSEAGGTGKTTLSANLGAALNRLEKQENSPTTKTGSETLVIDLDPQGSLTKYYGYERFNNSTELSHSDVMELRNWDEDRLKNSETPYKPLGDVLSEKNGFSLRDIVIEGEEVDIVPSHTSMSNFEVEVGGDAGASFLLKRALDDIKNEYQHVIIDPPASDGFLVKNAVLAAQDIIAPVELSRKGVQSVESVQMIRDALQEAVELTGFNFDLRLLGAVANMVQQSADRTEFREELSEMGYRLFPPEIPDYTVFADAWDANQSVFRYLESQERVPERNKRAANNVLMLANLIRQQGIEPSNTGTTTLYEQYIGGDA